MAKKFAHPLHHIWVGMIARCQNPNLRNYRNYGGRGIKVCERWQSSFENFIADMGPRPSGMHSIDRINNNGDYEPSNCRWATKAEQAQNKRNNRRLTISGTTMNLSQWARAREMPVTVLVNRLRRGWPESEAVNRPVRKLRTYSPIHHPEQSA